MLQFDQTKTYRSVEEKLARTTNPRHRLLLQRLLQHSRGEVEADLEAVMATLAPNPVYRAWHGSPLLSPSGTYAVRKFYVEEVFGRGRHVFESNKDRIVVDDDTIITEGDMRIIAWGRDARDNGIPIDDPDACYLMSVRVLIVWPFDTEGYILGEESWSVPVGKGLEKLTPEDVPENFQAYVRGRLKKAA